MSSDETPPGISPSSQVRKRITANRRARTAMRARSLDPSLEPIERAQILQDEVSPADYLDPRTGEPVGQVSPGVALLLDRAAAIRDALDSGMTQRQVAQALSIRPPTLNDLLKRADEALSRLTPQTTTGAVDAADTKDQS